MATSKTTPAAATAPVPAPHIAERLAYVRFLHQEGIRQTGRPHPMSSAAILSFHDAVELFFVAAFDHLQAPVGLQAPFPSYWPELAKLVPNLTGQRVTERLNRIRRDLKHHGVIPPHTQVSTVRADVATFLTANTKTVFGFDYETISMADLIPQTGVRVKVQAAQATEAAGDRREAMGLLAEAFDDLLHPEYDGGTHLPEQLNFAPRSASLHLHSPNFGETERVLYALRNEQSHVDVHRVASQIDATAEFAVAAQSALRLMAYGIDYPRYVQFRHLVPGVDRMMDGHIERGYGDSYAPAEEHFSQCVQFVVEAALRVAEVTSSIERPPWVRW